GEELIEEMLALESGERAGEEEELTQKVPVICPVYEPTSVPHQAAGIAAITRYLAQKYPWDLLFVQIHAPDILNHNALNEVCPDWAFYDPQRAEEAWERFRQEYKVLDAAVGEMLNACVDEETLVIVLSDHAAVPAFRTVWLGRSFLDAGLSSYKKENGKLVLDWSRTKAILADQSLASNQPLAHNVWVNLRGREMHGIIEPGEEYERVRSEAIKALYSLKDPETGECPIALALRKEDAALLGQWGDTVGDIVYYLRPGYAVEPTMSNLAPSEEAINAKTCFYPVGEGGIRTRHGSMQGLHGGYMPNAEIGGCSVRAVLLMAGPGIKRGYRLPLPPWTVDVAPTIAHFLGIPAPAQCEGKVVSTALEIG
ncbi:MAG: alkaline phosphatase family protein, partial [Chloroflexi bacterium]|nr:alkaline phosphatase family protein [Chloroflexota bacterium]